MLVNSTLFAGKSIRLVRVGAYHNIIILTSGDIFFWGASDASFERNGDVLSPIALPRIGALAQANIVELELAEGASFVLTDTGRVIYWGRSVDFNVVLPEFLNTSAMTGLTVRRMSCQIQHCLFLTTKNTVYGWGDNNCNYALHVYLYF